MRTARMRPDLSPREESENPKALSFTRYAQNELLQGNECSLHAVQPNWILTALATKHRQAANSVA